jgi:hypothetical protein
MSWGHTTCEVITPVRQSRFGHPEVGTKHRDGDKPAFSFFQDKFAGVRHCNPPRLRARGGSWEERRAKSKDKVKVRGKSQVKAKVFRNVRIPQPRLLPSFPSWMRGFCGIRGKMLRRSTAFSFSLPLILRRRRFRRGWANICLFLAGSNSSNIQPSIHPSIHSLAVRTEFGLRLRVSEGPRGQTNDGQDRRVH